MSSSSAVRFDFRVLVFQLSDTNAEFPFQAYCLEMNRVGRGITPFAALEDLGATMDDDLLAYLNDGIPLTMEPDPELLAAFEQRLPSHDGDRIHGFFRLSLRFAAVEEPAGAGRTKRVRATAEEFVHAFPT